MSQASIRRDDVLRAIVTDYVETGEPVGSKALVDRHDLRVSPATVRNDMSVLEEKGYLYQPHTSAGRIPTEKGYRAFVNQISKLRPITAAQRRAIEAFVFGAADFDDIVERTVRALAQLTRQLAIVQYPHYERSGLRHLEIIPVAEFKLLVIVITNSARVQQTTIDTRYEVDSAASRSLALLLNSTLQGMEDSQIAQLEPVLMAGASPEQLELISQILPIIREALTGEQTERIVMAGAGNLVRSSPEFSRSIGPILDALEEQVTLLRLFSEIDQQDSPVTVTIGSESGEHSLSETSIVAGAYGDKESGVAHVGIVGPQRMDYPQAMSIVRAVSRYLSRMMTR
ncbi:heat-inducible transcriptional repressor HrcA [uncultured Varibaculum sp.]|uniref:heat-inducible transcriptional repressor HrcA n=1 Tax=uncultured Varibaculum sp. TaxID=413896 RepID=UPI002674B0FE|nr:heat-inducible transcriptional repressor HrcA [uncultured Varibaculum sp.]